MQGCYVVRRTYGKDIFLHPFSVPRSSENWELGQKLQLQSSKEVESDLHEQFLYTVYKAIDADVDRWILELKYIPRLLISAIAFLVVYFFLSYVVRDPIPLIDELLFASGSAVAAFILTANRTRRSEVAMKKRLVLKQEMEQIGWEINPQVEVVEQLLKRFDETPGITLADMICGESGPEGEVLPLGSYAGDDYLRIAGYLRSSLDAHGTSQKMLKEIDDVDTDRERMFTSARLLSLHARKRIDLPLIALYLSIR